MLEGKITLIELTPKSDSCGYDDFEVTNETVVFADRISPYRDEFYKAAKAGYKLSAQFKLMTDEYNGEQQVKHESKHYKVIRSYPTDRIYTILVCEEVI